MNATELTVNDLNDISGGNEVVGYLGGAATGGAFSATLSSLGLSGALAAAGAGSLAVLGAGAIIGISGALVVRAGYEGALAAEAVWDLFWQ